MTKFVKSTWVLASLSLMLGSFSAHAQDLSKVQPEPVPQLVEPEVVVNPNEFAVFDSGAAEDEEIILPELKGLVFLADPERVNSISFSSLGDKQAWLDDFPDFQNIDFDYIVDSFVGSPVSAESMERLVRATRLYLRQINKPFSVVYYPEQDITEGYLQLVVLESRFDGEVVVEGNRYFDDQLYTRMIRQQPGETIDQAQLDQDIAWLNRNPFRAASVIASPGSTQATTKLVVRARERKPVRLFAGANNTGTQSTTEDRALVGFDWGNAFGLGHQLTMQVTGDLKFDHSRSLSGSYTVDLPWRHSFNISGAYSETDGIVAEPFNLEGKSSQVGLSYSVPLPTAFSGSLSQNLNIGLDFKSSDNNFDFADIPVSDNVTEVVQLKAQYSGTLVDRLGITTGSLTLTYAPGNLSGRNKDEFFELSRSNASADYIYSRLNLNRRTPLKGKFEGWQWNVRFSVQISDHNLVGSEQFGAGGSGSVRGYEEGEVYGDEGVLLSHELVFPTISPGKKFGLDVEDSFTLFVFQDFAETRSVVKLPGEENFQLYSLGLGFRYQYSQLLSAQASWGHQMRDSGSSDTGENHRLHLSVRLSL